MTWGALDSGTRKCLKGLRSSSGKAKWVRAFHDPRNLPSADWVVKLDSPIESIDWFFRVFPHFPLEQTTGGKK